MRLTKIILSILIPAVGISACSSYNIKRYKLGTTKSIITGKIVDAHSGSILPGAVRAGDTTTIAMADNNGIYKAQLKPANYKIRAGFVGYKLSKPKTIKINLETLSC